MGFESLKAQKNKLESKKIHKDFWMDSSVLLAGIGVLGTLGGVVIGAWLNPLMKDRHKKQKLREFITNCTKVEKFVILRL